MPLPLVSKNMIKALSEYKGNKPVSITPNIHLAKETQEQLLKDMKEKRKQKIEETIKSDPEKLLPPKNVGISVKSEKTNDEKVIKQIKEDLLNIDIKDRFTKDLINAAKRK